MFCKHCGASIAEGGKFCPKCGTPATVPTAPAPISSAVSAPPMAPVYSPIAPTSPLVNAPSVRDRVLRAFGNPFVFISGVILLIAGIFMLDDFFQWAQDFDFYRYYSYMARAIFDDGDMIEIIDYFMAFLNFFYYLGIFIIVPALFLVASGGCAKAKGCIKAGSVIGILSCVSFLIYFTVLVFEDTFVLAEYFEWADGDQLIAPLLWYFQEIFGMLLYLGGIIFFVSTIHTVNCSDTLASPKRLGGVLCIIGLIGRLAFKIFHWFYWVVIENASIFDSFDIYYYLLQLCIVFIIVAIFMIRSKINGTLAQQSKTVF